MSSVATLRYPAKSHRKIVRLPEKSSKLAEFFGIMLGDGGIGNPWQLSITMNAEKDAQYAEYISDLCDHLFGIRPTSRKRQHTNALVLVLNSTTVVDFLISQGLSSGNKLEKGLRIPSWVLANFSYRTTCVRGLMDTDGCLYIHRHTTLGNKYQNIGLCFTSESGELIRQVADVFRQNDIEPHIIAQNTRIYLCSARAVESYLRVFGTSNPRISGLYESWKEAKVPDRRFKASVV